LICATQRGKARRRDEKAAFHIKPLRATDAEEDVRQPEDRDEQENARRKKHRANRWSMSAEGEDADYQRERGSD
jgi:hypothetical protein